MQGPAERKREDDSVDGEDSLGQEARPDKAEAAEEEELLSPASQIGREQMGGSPGSGQEPGTNTKEGWPMPDQTDTPSKWPEPTID
jgi:hypothetical protein